MRQNLRYFNHFNQMVVLTTFFMFFWAAISHAQDKIVFSGGAPLDTYQPSIIVPLLTEAFKRNGIKFEAQYLPSKRSLLKSNSGDTDGELHRVYEFQKVTGNAYPNLIRIESEMMVVYFAAFASRDMNVKDVDDLNGLKLVFKAGRKNLQKILGSRYSKSQIRTYTTDREALLMVARGRYDLAFTESFDGAILIHQNEALRELREVMRVSRTPIYSYIHKKHAHLAGLIAETLEKMKADGTYAQISAAVRKRLMESPSN